MKRGAVVAILAVLALAACQDDPDDPQAEAPEAPEEPQVEVDEDPDTGAVPVAEGPFGMAFEGLWRFEGPTEAALVLEPGADADAIADDVAAEPGVEDVARVDEAEVDERGDLGVLVSPDESMPPVLLVTTENQQSAAAFADADDREGVQFAFAPTCDALAGTARYLGTDQAETWLDDAGCDEVVIIDADPDSDQPWVVAAGVHGDALCIATAAPDAAMSTCQDGDDDPSGRVITGAGGFVLGFAPEATDTVEIDIGQETVTTRAVTVAEASKVYAAHMPDSETDPDAGVVEAPDIGAIDVRFLDADGEVVEEA